jgi:outer membrane protein TolC
MKPFLIAGLLLLAPGFAPAQSQPGAGGPGTSRAVQQMPPEVSGSVTTRQSPVSGSGPATIDSSLQIDGNYAGAVPSGAVSAGPLTLTLSEAVKLGLAANLGPLTAGDAARVARAQRLQALSALLPNISADASNTVTQVNLAAYGLKLAPPPGVNFSIPTVVGPYNYSSLEATLSQSIYDPVQRRNWKASKESERASLASAKNARELVVLAVGGSYLQALSTAARVASQLAQVANAEAIYRQAQARKLAGTNSRLDVNRSHVELQTEQQRLGSLEASLVKEKIALARLIGLPMDRQLILSDPLGFVLAALPDAPAAIERAFRYRSDLAASDAQVSAAAVSLSAARGERLPSVSFNGNYGVIGPNPASTHGVFAATASLNVPIWQGGRAKADIEQAQATLHQRQAERDDQRTRVEQEVRAALVDLETAAGQVRLSDNNRALAKETLDEARDRFIAGVSTTVEVVQAQQQLASAESDYISSLFSFNLSKLSLARATGTAERDLADLLPQGKP